MRPPAKKIFGIVLLMAVLLLSSHLIAHAQAQGDQSVATKPKLPAALPDLADLIPLAAELSGRLAVLEKTVAARVDLSAVEKNLSGIEANLQNPIVQLQKLEAPETSRYLQLVELKTAVEHEAATLEKVNKGFNGEIRKLGTLRQEWLAEKNRWKEWQSSLLKEEPLDKVKSTFAKALKTMDTALNLIRLELDPLLTIQEKAGNIRARIISLTAELDGLILARGDGVVLESYPPLLSSRYFSQFGSELWLGLQSGLAEVSLPGRRFFTQQGWIVFLQALLSLALIIVIYRNRHVLKDSKRWRFIADRPFSAGFFLGVLTTSAFYEYGGVPASWELVLTIVAAISFARLVGGLVEASWKRQFVYGLMIVYIVTKLLYVVSLPLPLLRLYIVVTVLVGLIFFLRWAGESGRHEDRLFYAWALRLGSFFLVVVVIAELWGKAGLASYLLVASVWTIAIALILWLFMHLVRGGLAWVFHSSPLRRVTVLRSNADRVIRELAFLFYAFIGVFYLSGILVIWRVYDSVPEATKALLSLRFNLGSQRITVGLIIVSAALLYASLIISWILRALLTEGVLAKRQVDAGVQHSVGRLVHYALVLIGLLLAFTALGFELTKVTIIISALGVGIGFGLQTVVNNFVCGLIMLFERPVRVGDYIEIGGLWAEIRKIGLRATVVRTFDAAEIVVPNSDLISNQVTNWTLSDRGVRLIIAVGVAYGSDVPLVTETLMECAMASSKVLRMPEPQVLFRDFGESSLDFELRVWISNVDDRLQVASDLRHDIDRRFQEKGIVIAFPQRDLHIRSVDESPGSILIPPGDQQSDLVVVSSKDEQV
jgi:small-conductance mechanosensitive channel